MHTHLAAECQWRVSSPSQLTQSALLESSQKPRENNPLPFVANIQVASPARSQPGFRLVQCTQRPGPTQGRPQLLLPSPHLPLTPPLALADSTCPPTPKAVRREECTPQTFVRIDTWHVAPRRALLRDLAPRLHEQPSPKAACSDGTRPLSPPATEGEARRPVSGRRAPGRHWSADWVLRAPPGALEPEKRGPVERLKMKAQRLSQQQPWLPAPLTGACPPRAPLAVTQGDWGLGGWTCSFAELQGKSWKRKANLQTVTEERDRKKRKQAEEAPSHHVLEQMRLSHGQSERLQLKHSSPKTQVWSGVEAGSQLYGNSIFFHYCLLITVRFPDEQL